MKSDAIGVNVFRDGQAVELSGCTATGYFTKPDGQMVKLDGVVTGNTAFIVMQRACYMQPGRIRLAITISDGTTLSTVRIVNGFVQETITDDEFWKDVQIYKAMQTGQNEVTLAWHPNVIADMYWVYEVNGEVHQFRGFTYEPQYVIKNVPAGLHVYAVRPKLGSEFGNNNTTEVTVSESYASVSE